jgi:hypothetical protein
MLKCKNKRGQVGETVSWVIATIVIIGVLIAFLWISSLLSKVKAITAGEVRSDLNKESVVLTGKTSLAHKLENNKNKDVIDNLLKENG